MIQVDFSSPAIRLCSHKRMYLEEPVVRNRTIMFRRALPPVFPVSWATGITIYLENHGRLEHAQQIAGRKSPRTTMLFDLTAKFNISGSVIKPMSAINANQHEGSHMIVEHSLGSSLISPNCLHNLTIVVVEDQDDARRYLGVFLRQLGANVVVARDAFEGLEAVKTSRPNLVLADIKMPGRDGIELLRKIRSLGMSAGGSVPIIAMSALVTHASARMFQAGFQACLPKPFTPDKLVETILNVLYD
jgi:CheY-like chemotaxis protein